MTAGDTVVVEVCIDRPRLFRATVRRVDAGLVRVAWAMGGRQTFDARTGRPVMGGVHRLLPASREHLARAAADEAAGARWETGGAA